MGLKQRKLRLILVAVAMFMSIAFLVLLSLSPSLSYFYTPSELQAELRTDKLAGGTNIRLGGVVSDDSIKHEGTNVSFIIADGVAAYKVKYDGILPALFQEGSSAIVEGYLGEDDVFRASQILAKHDENYMPKKLTDVVNSISDKNYRKSSS